ncbi:MAG: hypothetical protein ACKOFV_02190, partial [Candidatus Nanopelagicaceae bacterium]
MNSDQELIARAQLLASTEAGVNFWAREVYAKGALEVLELCRAGAYQFEVDKILATNGAQILENVFNKGFE